MFQLQSNEYLYSVAATLKPETEGVNFFIQFYLAENLRRGQTDMN